MRVGGGGLSFADHDLGSFVSPNPNYTLSCIYLSFPGLLYTIIYIQRDQEDAGEKGDWMDIWLQTALYPACVSLIASTFHHLSIPRTNITNITRQTNYKYYNYKYYKYQ